MDPDEEVGTIWRPLGIGSGPGPAGYPKSARLLNRREFLALNGAGVLKIRTGAFLVLARPNQLAWNRLGVTVTKKVSAAAVGRNRIKRQVREFFRQRRAGWPQGLDILVIAHSQAARMDGPELRGNLAQAESRLIKAGAATSSETDRGAPSPPKEAGATGTRQEKSGGPAEGSAPQAAPESGDGAETGGGPEAPLSALAVARRVPVYLALGLIFIYRRFISPMFPPACRFYPTCSQYAAQVFQTHGFARGLFLTIRRLMRCHPLGGSGYDPAPPKNARPGRTFSTRPQERRQR